MKQFKMKELPLSEQPEEIFRLRGAKGLTDAQLLALILRSGSKQNSALYVAEKLLSKSQGNLLNLYSIPFVEMTKIEGIGKVKAMQLKCIAELSTRMGMMTYNRGQSFHSAEMIASQYLPRFRHERIESLICLFLDTKCNLIKEKIISTGTVNSSVISPREIFISAIQNEAVYIILMHNHPSGDEKPSNTDIEVTNTLFEAGQIIGIEILDHIILGDNTYYSMKEHNLLMK